MSGISERLENLVGVELGPSRSIGVDQDLIDSFAAATFDEQWIHVDPVRAAHDSPFGGTVAHGMLTLSLVPGLAIELLGLESAPLVINYGFERVRFPAPVPAGSSLALYLTLNAVRPVNEAVRVHFEARVEAEGQAKPACVAGLIFQVHG